MCQTQTAVVISEEQGEMEKFRRWNLDATSHRRLIKEGIALPEAYSEAEAREKTEAVFIHVFRVYSAMPSPDYASMPS